MRTRIHAERWYKVRSLVRQLRRVVVAHGQIDVYMRESLRAAENAETDLDWIEARVGGEISTVTRELLAIELTLRKQKDRKKKKG